MQKKMKTKTTAIIKFEDGQLEVKVSSNDLASLTELWKRAGSPDSKRPKDWLEMVESQNFIVYLRSLKGSDQTLLEIKVGRSGGTYADVQIALKYAQWLSPEFQKTVNDVFIQRVEEEIDPELGIQRAVDRHTKRLKALGRDDSAVAKRLKTVEKRNTLTSTLRDHGVTAGKSYWQNGFAQVTEAEYLGWKGKKTSELKKDLGIDKGNLRDHLSEWDLDQLAFLESCLEQKIKKENLYGNQACQNTAHSVGKAVAKLVEHVLPKQITA